MRTQSGNYFRNQIHLKSPRKRWYVLANRVEAVFYEDYKDHHFKFKERIRNPRGRLSEIQLDSDRPGIGVSSAGAGSIRHGLDRTFQHHEQNAERFAKVISRHLMERKREIGFHELVLVAEPHFLGLLRKSLPSELSDIVENEIRREYLEGSDLELRSIIENALKK